MAYATEIVEEIAGAEGVDIKVLREKYRVERDKRLTGAGLDQYIRIEGDYSRFAGDHFTPRKPRQSITEEVEVLIIGAGLGGLAVGAKVRRAGFEVRLLDNASDAGGT